MSNFIKSYQANVGLNHVPAYQVSGQPFATGSINASTAVKVEFPYVTRWIYVKNNGADDCKLGFSQNGVENSNFITIHHTHTNQLDGHSLVFDLKVSEIWLSGSNNVDVLAGLTSIPASRTTTDSGPSWSGSAGVG